MHPEEAAFRRAIVAEPFEDARRLAFADWLDEHGRSKRADLIRHQIATGGWTRMPPTELLHYVECWPGPRPVETEHGGLPVLTAARGFVWHVDFFSASGQFGGFRVGAGMWFCGQPITSVRFAGPVVRGGLIFRGGKDGTDTDVPADLFELLGGHKLYHVDGAGTFSEYPDDATAAADLNRAAVLWGRQLADAVPRKTAKAV